MAKKVTATAPAKTADKKTNSENSNVVYGHDPRNREVRLISDSEGFTVTKEQCNAPYRETFKTHGEAIIAADAQIEDTTS